MTKLLPYILMASFLGSLNSVSTYLTVKTHQHAYMALVKNPQSSLLV